MIDGPSANRMAESLGMSYHFYRIERPAGGAAARAMALPHQPALEKSMANSLTDSSQTPQSSRLGATRKD